MKRKLIVRNVIFLMVIGLAGMLISPYTHAQSAQDFFKVQKIAVDVIASDARKAQALALEQGHRRAFTVMLRRLTTHDNHNLLPILPTSVITPMVSGFQVANEKISSTRYIADLTFEFKRQGIRRLLQARQIPYSETASKPILILPVFSQAGGTVLWEEPNIWREVWTNVIDGDLRDGASQQQIDDWGQIQPLPIIVPTGDFTDLRLVNVDQALATNAESLDAMAKYYGAGDVLVIHAGFSPGSTETEIRLDVAALRYSNDGVTSVIDSFTGKTDPDEGIRPFLQQTIALISEKLQDDWKRDNVLKHNSSGMVSVIVPIQDLKGWMKIQRQVQTVASVTRIKIREISVKAAAIEITHLGDVDQLRLALAQKDLHLSSENGYWRLERRR